MATVPMKKVWLKEDGREAVIAAANFNPALHSEKPIKADEKKADEKASK